MRSLSFTRRRRRSATNGASANTELIGVVEDIARSLQRVRLHAARQVSLQHAGRLNELFAHQLQAIQIERVAARKSRDFLLQCLILCGAQLVEAIGRALIVAARGGDIACLTCGTCAAHVHRQLQRDRSDVERITRVGRRCGAEAHWLDDRWPFKGSCRLRFWRALVVASTPGALAEKPIEDAHCSP